MSDDALDNPIWHALTGPLAHVAEGNGLARRFRPDISAFAGLGEDSAEAWAGLATLSEPGQEVILIRRNGVHPPPRWTYLGGGTGFQMILEGEPQDAPIDGDIRPLGDDDVPAMLALVGLTEPGPFRERTIELGGYVGIEVNGQLLAMAGQRINLDEHIEVSGVCTHPDARRRGYAAAVSAEVARRIQQGGKTPILHVAEHNTGAKRVYEQLGFVTRTMMTFAGIRTPARP